MKILIVHPQNPELESTWSRAPFYLIRALKKKEITVFSSAIGPQGFFSKIFFKIIQVLTRFDYHYSRIFRVFSSYKLSRAIDKYKPDCVLHMGGSFAITYLKTSISNFLYTDNTWHLLKTVGKGFLSPVPSDKKIRRYSRLQLVDYNKFEKIFTQTTVSQKDFIDYYKIPAAKVLFVGNGVANVKPFYGAKDYSKNVILFVAGHSFKRKGGELLIDAFRIVQKTIPSATLVIEGGVKPTNYYQDIQKIELLGRSDNTVLQKLYKEASLLVMPAIFEPFGLVYLEALINKTPVVGLNRGALPDITNKGQFGYLANDATPQSVANKIIEALSDLERLGKVALGGQRFILNHYTWGKVGDNILSGIESRSNI